MIEFDPVAHRYTADGVTIPSVTSIIKDLGLLPWYPEDPKYRARGDAVHLACELFDTDVLDRDTTDPAILQYLAGYETFKSESGFHPLHLEQVVYSQKHSFAGTMDRYGLLDGEPVILDIKSGEVPSSTALQTAGYAVAWQEQTGIQCLRRVGLRLYPDGRYSTKEWRGVDDQFTFLACLRVWRWKSTKGR